MSSHSHISTAVPVDAFERRVERCPHAGRRSKPQNSKKVAVFIGFTRKRSTPCSRSADDAVLHHVETTTTISTVRLLRRLPAHDVEIAEIAFQSNSGYVEFVIELQFAMSTTRRAPDSSGELASIAETIQFMAKIESSRSQVTINARFGVLER